MKTNKEIDTQLIGILFALLVTVFAFLNLIV